MARLSWLKYVHLAYLAKPRAERRLYRLIKRHRVRRIVEVGIGRLERSVALVGVAARYAAGSQVFYTGIDWFDARPADRTPLALKAAHTRLRTTEAARIRLVPGEPAAALAAAANALQQTDLLLLSAAVSDESLASAWFYVPRMLHGESTVLREQLDATGQPTFDAVSPARIAELADSAAISTGRRAA